MGSQRGGQDWVNELNWQPINKESCDSFSWRAKGFSHNIHVSTLPTNFPPLPSRLPHNTEQLSAFLFQVFYCKWVSSTVISWSPCKFLAQQLIIILGETDCANSPFLLEFLPSNCSIPQCILPTITVVFAYWWYSSLHIYSLEFFHKEELPLLIYVFNYLYQYGLMDIYFTLGVIIQYYHYLSYHELFQLCH